MSLTPPFKDSPFYKICISPLIKVGFAFVGDTMPIWGSLLVSFVLVKILPSGAWPGLSFFINDGTIIVISFAFLSSALYYSTRNLKINLLNVSTSLLVLISILLFTRAIGLKVTNESNHNEPHSLDDQVYYGSIAIFIISFFLYYIVLVEQKYKANRSNLTNERNKTQASLEQDFRKNKSQ
jgi:hypothetical protein